MDNIHRTSFIQQRQVSKRSRNGFIRVRDECLDKFEYTLFRVLEETLSDLNCAGSISYIDKLKPITPRLTFFATLWRYSDIKKYYNNCTLDI